MRGPRVRGLLKSRLRHGNHMESEGRWRPSHLPMIIAIMALLIILVGGTVRINDAGVSCPDWPQCFGTLTFDVSEEDQLAWYEENPGNDDSKAPYSSFDIFTEWFHRLLVGVIALPVLLNVVFAFKGENKRLKNLSIAILGLLAVQAIAGALTVFYKNVDWSVALHLVLALFFVSILLWQWLLMRINENADWEIFKTPPSVIHSHFSRIIMMTIGVLILMILGAWVASTAGGQYNQSCSVGLGEGWPQCQGDWFPSLEGTGILVQMIHRIGALAIGLALITGSMRIRTSCMDVNSDCTIAKFFEASAGFWLLNIFVGGFYIILAEGSSFPEWLSLVHLMVGVASFLSAALGLMFAVVIRDLPAPEEE